MKVWGEDLEPKLEEELEVDQMDYADSTYTPVNALMYNRDLGSRSNEIAPRFRICNTSEDAIKLSDIRLYYFYTTDGPEDQIFEVDFAGIGSRYGSTINKNDVKCGFTKVDDSNLATKCVADISFIRDDLYIQPGEYLELQIRIHRPTWTKYVQENDFSFNPDSKDYEEWKKIAVYIDDRWVWGSIPLSYTEIIDPDPHEDEEDDTTYKEESKESYVKTTDKEGNTTEYTYDDNGNITTIVDAEGNKSTNHYNERGQITSTIDALGNKTTYDYDSKGNVSSQTFTYEYDKNGNRTKQSKISSSSTETISYTYDELNQLTKVTDKNGTRTYSFDEFNNRSKKQETGKDPIEYTYNKLNELIKSTKGSKETIYEYDKRGNLTKVKEDGETTKAYTFDSMNKMSKVVIKKDGKMVTSKFTYDGLGNRINAKVDTNGQITSNTSYVVDTQSPYQDIHYYCEG